MDRIYSDSVLKINLKNLVKNFKLINNINPNSSAFAVVKSDAYGLGVKEVSTALYKAKCRDFFVATLDEAIYLRSLHKDINIYVFHGFEKSQIDIFLNYSLIPVINSIDQLKTWYKKAPQYPAIIHVDTGMNRLGIIYEHLNEDIISFIKKLNILFIMSHMSCADIKDHKMNELQLKKFLNLKKIFNNYKLSLANSASVFLGSDYHFDILRPGIALYGSNAFLSDKKHMLDVISLDAKIIQIHNIDTKRPIGYAATSYAKKDKKIITIPVGYADGILRSLSNKGKCFLSGKFLPIIGRVSMDLITLDASEVEPKDLKIGNKVQIIGSDVNIDMIAQDAGTIAYEILTNLGSRYKRIYC